MVHDFNNDLAGSMGAEDDARVEAILREYFGSPQDFRVDWSPRDTPYGHDCEVVAWGECYRIEEKRRRSDYGDELLEDISNDETATPGWTRKCGSVDYVLHLYPRRHEIFPGMELQNAFIWNADLWRGRFGQRAAQNRGYRTINVPVPTRIVIAAIHAFGAPLCDLCGNAVGRFRVTCAQDQCDAVSCCHISDGEWFCASCERE